MSSTIRFTTLQNNGQFGRSGFRTGNLPQNKASLHTGYLRRFHRPHPGGGGGGVTPVTGFPRSLVPGLFQAVPQSWVLAWGGVPHPCLGVPPDQDGVRLSHFRMAGLGGTPLATTGVPSPRSGWGTPPPPPGDSTAERVLATWRAVCLLL